MGTELLNAPLLTMKWRTAPGSAKLTQKESIVTGMVLSTSVDPTTGNVTVGPPPPGIDPTAVESGPFAGLDGGASTQFTLSGGSFLTQKCDTRGGLKTISMGDGSVFIG